MGLRGIVTKAKDTPAYKGKGMVHLMGKDKSAPLPATIEDANKKWKEVFAVEKVMNDGTLAPTSLKFNSNDEYLDWIIDGGPDRDLKDPEGEYKVIRTWIRR